jgi:hypothetical protein
LNLHPKNNNKKNQPKLLQLEKPQNKSLSKK